MGVGKYTQELTPRSRGRTPYSLVLREYGRKSGGEAIARKLQHTTTHCPFVSPADILRHGAR